MLLLVAERVLYVVLLLLLQLPFLLSFQLGTPHFPLDFAFLQEALELLLDLFQFLLGDLLGLESLRLYLFFL